jgi:protein-tyrosine phosphatase
MILEKAGGKRAALKSLYHKVLYQLGFYVDYSRPDWQQVNRLVFVCMGNINRSAYGEAKAKSLGMASYSYGIDADESKGASEEALRNGSARGIDLSSHHCRSINNIELQQGDLILAVEPDHLEAIANAIAKVNKSQTLTQTTLLGIWARSPTPFLQDPICRSDIYFGSCFNKIDEAIYRIVAEIEQAKVKQLASKL